MARIQIGGDGGVRSGAHRVPAPSANSTLISQSHLVSFKVRKSVKLYRKNVQEILGLSTADEIQSKEIPSRWQHMLQNDVSPLIWGNPNMV